MVRCAVAHAFAVFGPEAGRGATRSQVSRTAALRFVQTNEERESLDVVELQPISDAEGTSEFGDQPGVNGDHFIDRGINGH